MDQPTIKAHPPVEGRLSCSESNLKPDNKMIYIGTPYWHDDAQIREFRYKHATEATAFLVRAGYAVFSPITHAHAMHKEFPNVPRRGWNYWKHSDLPILEQCGLLVILTLDGWTTSVGLNGEMNRAHELNIPMLYVRPREIYYIDTLVEQHDFEGKLLIKEG